jgi:hypothetical protein
MARTAASLPAGSRITDYISLGVIAKTFPVEQVRAVLAATGTASRRQRDLPAHVVIYYVIALALYMQSSTREVLRCLLEGVQWLLGPGATVKVAGKSSEGTLREKSDFQSCCVMGEVVAHVNLFLAARNGTGHQLWLNWRIPLMGLLNCSSRRLGHLRRPARWVNRL